MHDNCMTMSLFPHKKTLLLFFTLHLSYISSLIKINIEIHCLQINDFHMKCYLPQINF